MKTIWPVAALAGSCSFLLAFWSRRVDCCVIRSPFLCSRSPCFQMCSPLSCDMNLTTTWQIEKFNTLFLPPCSSFRCMYCPCLPDRMDECYTFKKYCQFEQIATASYFGRFSHGRAVRDLATGTLAMTGQSACQTLSLNECEHHPWWPIAVQAAGAQCYLRYRRLPYDCVTN